MVYQASKKSGPFSGEQRQGFAMVEALKQLLDFGVAFTEERHSR